MTTTTTTTPRRGDLVTTPSGAETRVTSTRGGYVHTPLGTFAPWQLARPAPDPAAAARVFLDAQAAAMREWGGGDLPLPSRRDHETALAHIAALLREIGR